MAIRHYVGKDLSGLIHHSDRGVQYASYAYTGRLKDCQIRISMTESGNPKDNAVAERVNNTIKNELLKGMVFYRIREVKAAVKVAVEFTITNALTGAWTEWTPSEPPKVKEI